MKLTEVMIEYTDFFRGVLMLVCVVAVPYYAYAAYRIYKRERVVRAQGAGGKIFLAIVFFSIVKIGLLAPSGMLVYVHNGEKAVFVEPNLFWKNKKTELQLRFDPEAEARLWMMETEQGYRPFFTSPH